MHQRPAAPHIPDDPEAIILQAQLKRIKAEKDAKEAAEPEAEPEPDDKTPDPAAESNQAATSIPQAVAVERCSRDSILGSELGHSPAT